MSPKDREKLFWAKVKKGNRSGCWLWTAYKTKLGYGRFFDGTRQINAHRWAYLIRVGGIPDGFVIDHLCRNPGCVNPKHLEAVTQGENVRRGESAHAKNWRKTHCKRGHEFTEENTYKGVTKYGGVARMCRCCRTASITAWNLKVRAEKKAKANG